MFVILVTYIICISICYKSCDVAKTVYYEGLNKNAYHMIDELPHISTEQILKQNQRIYTKYVDCKALPNAGNKTYSLDIPSGFAWVDLSNSYVYSNAPSLRTIFPMNYHNEKTGSSITFSLSENDKTITFGTTDDWSAYNAFVVVKYYKY